MDEKSTAGSRENDVDRTIIIPAEKIISPEQKAGAERTAAASPASGAAGEGSGRRSILSDLGNFLFPRRTAVDDTIELIRSGGKKSEIPPAPPAPPAPSDAPAARVSELYEVNAEPFASGGQGRISLAVDRALGCSVALKSLHDQLCSDEQARRNFLNEAKLTASLDHPSVIPIHGLFGDGGNGMHLAMKLISGHTLSDYLENIVSIYEKKGVRRFDEQKSLRNRMEIFLRVCDAMEYAHARRIIHRDLKPENIMIGRHRETYVTDWGLAVSLDDPMPSDKVHGTPAFIAPEVLATRKSDVRSDIYALGLILFELVTLRPAFSGDDLSTLLKQVRQGQHAPLRHRFKCRIDGDLKAVILKAIALDPEKRYQQVSDLAEDIRRCLANEETTARPDNLFSGLCRWGVNHRRGMLVTMLVLLLLGVAAVARTLYREMLWSTEKRLHDNAIGAAYNGVTGTANALGKSLQKIEYQLEQLRLNLLFSTLKVEGPVRFPRNYFVPMEKYVASPPPSFVDSDSYRHPVDPENAGIFNYLGKKVDMSQLKFFANTGHCMRQSVLGLIDSKDERNEKAAVEFLLKKAHPVKKIYFVLRDGTFACYPGSRDDFPPGYYPPGRIWYQRAVEAEGRLVWSGPYRDSGVHGESVITCSAAMFGADRKIAAIVAIDFSLTQLARELLIPTDRKYRGVCEKLLLNSAGKVIFRIVPGGRHRVMPFDDPRLLRRMGKMKYGTIQTTDPDTGREMLLAFAHLDAIDVLYVEYLDLTSLIEEQQKNNNGEMSGGGFGRMLPRSGAPASSAGKKRNKK